MANFYKKNLTWKSCSPKFFQTNSNEEYFFEMAKTIAIVFKKSVKIQSNFKTMDFSNM